MFRRNIIYLIFHITIKQTERPQRERKYHQDRHLERGKHDRQRTRGRGFYGVKEDQHYVHPGDKVEGRESWEMALSYFTLVKMEGEMEWVSF